LYVSGNVMHVTADDGASRSAIGELLRTYRKRSDLTQEQLAEAAGVTGGLIGNVERGTRNLGPETVERVADALRLSTTERQELNEARRRYAESSAASTKAGPPPWAEILDAQRELSAQQREISDRLGRIAELLERRN
jgi:transcriptional regulator with XRE-family HTH domain